MPACGRLWALSSIFARFRELPLIGQIVLGLVAIGVLVLLSPLEALVALLVFLVSLPVLLYKLLRRQSLRRWGLIAAASFVLMFAFAGISGAMYPAAEQGEIAPGEEPVATDDEPATTAETTREEKASPPPETTEERQEEPEEESKPKPDESERQEQASQQQAEPPPPPEPTPE